MIRWFFALLTILLAFGTASANPLDLPLNQLWRIDLNAQWVTLGPTWSVDSSIHMLVGADRRVLELVDGEIVAASDTLDGRVTAVERADVNGAEGIEALVGIVTDSLNSLLILNGIELNLISEILLGANWLHYDNPEDSLNEERQSWYEETCASKWLGGEDSTLLVLRKTVYGSRVEYAGSTWTTGMIWKMNLLGEIVGDSIECAGEEINCWKEEESGDHGFLVGGSQIHFMFADLSSGNTIRNWINSLDARGERTGTQLLSSMENEWFGWGGAHSGTELTSTGSAPLPDGGFAAFECISYDTSDEWSGQLPLLCSLYVQHVGQLDPIGVYDLGARPVVSMTYLPPDGVAENRPNLLCLSADGTIRLFDLIDLKFNQQEYSWPPASNELLAGDFDNDGRTELIGLSRDVLTCARLRTLKVASPSPLNPSTLNLLTCFPNPFNSSAAISYSLPHPGRYALDVVDVSGRLVTRLSDEWKEAGSYREVWNVHSQSSGCYRLILSGQNVASTSILLQK